MIFALWLLSRYNLFDPKHTMFKPSFLRKHYHPLNTIEISQHALTANYQYLSNLSRLKVAPVLRSNAYGNGLVLTAKILDQLNPPFFCVDSLYEAYELYKVGIKTKILIMGYVNPENLRTKKLPFSYAVYNQELVAAINKYQPHAGIHIFVDTGMHREGISIKELPEFISLVKQFKNINIEGLMSHFAAADKPTDPSTKKQTKEFEDAQEIVKSLGISTKWIHIAASSGLLHHTDYKNIGNIARTGIVLYGIDPEGKNNNLKPVLQLSTTIAQIKTIQKGDKVGYDFIYTAQNDMQIGILPLGYFDGVDRRLTNKGFVKVNETFCPIIGRVSMNITTIDLSNIQNPQVGQSVTVFSNNPEDKNSISNAAKQCDTIPYDLLVHIASTTKRNIT